MIPHDWAEIGHASILSFCLWSHLFKSRNRALKAEIHYLIGLKPIRHEFSRCRPRQPWHTGTKRRNIKLWKGEISRRKEKDAILRVIWSLLNWTLLPFTFITSLSSSEADKGFTYIFQCASRVWDMLRFFVTSKLYCTEQKKHVTSKQ